MSYPEGHLHPTVRGYLVRAFILIGLLNLPVVNFFFLHWALLVSVVVACEGAVRMGFIWDNVSGAADRFWHFVLVSIGIIVALIPLGWYLGVWFWASRSRGASLDLYDLYIQLALLFISMLYLVVLRTSSRLNEQITAQVVEWSALMRDFPSLFAILLLSAWALEASLVLAPFDTFAPESAQTYKGNAYALLFGGNATFGLFMVVIMPLFEGLRRITPRVEGIAPMARTVLLGGLALFLLTKCSSDYHFVEGQYPLEMPRLGADSRDRFERDKREHVYIEEIELGSGVLAAHGRRITAHLSATYAAGGTIYEGPITIYQGFPLYNPPHPHLLSSGQEGIALGLNGMAVGGRRRFTVERPLICSTYRDAGPNAQCSLLWSERYGSRVDVRKEPITVEATLDESCIPLRFKMWRFQNGYIIDRELDCRSSINGPQYEVDAPLWHFY